LGWRQPELGDTRRQLLARLRHAILRRDAIGAAQDRAERAEVLLAERRAGSAPHRHRVEPLIVLDPRQELAHQARLAPARIANQAHPVSLARNRPFEAIEHTVELGIAADQRRVQAQHLQPAGLARGVERTDQAVYRMLAALALERDLAHGLEAEGMAGMAVG